MINFICSNYLLYIILFAIALLIALLFKRILDKKNRFRIQANFFQVGDNYLFKQKFKSYVFSLIGVILLIATITGFVFWETRGREWALYSKVVVLNKDVYKGTLITGDMISVVPVERLSIIDESISNPDLILGKEARHFIPAYTQLHPFYFEAPALVLRPDQFIAKIPKDWIYAVPGTLRRSDKVVFYAVNPDNDARIHSEPRTQMDGGPVPTLTTYQDVPAQIASGRPFYETVVAYVKDSANREVRTVSKEDRFDANANISMVEIVVTLEELRMLENAYNQGKKFIIMYSEGEELYENMPYIQ